MAAGDDAAAAGYELVAGTDDRRDGWLEINKTRDYLAQLKVWVIAQLGGKVSGTVTIQTGTTLPPAADNAGVIFFRHS